MEPYYRNRDCGCPRCLCSGYMGPAVLVTLGLLFLIDEFTRFGFHTAWPLLLIVIGLVRVLQWNAPITGHLNPPGIGAASAGEQAPKSSDPQVPHV